MGTFSAAGTSSAVLVTPGAGLSVVLSGTFVATVVLEQQTSGAWRQLQTYTGAVTVNQPADPGNYRLNCTVYTSGTVTYTLAILRADQVDAPGTVVGTMSEQNANAVIVTGGTIDGTVIGATTPAAVTGTAIVGTSVTNSALTSGRVVYSTTGGAETDSANLTFSGTNLTCGGTVTGTQLVSNIATGTAPLSVASTTAVANLNASQLLGGTWASPGAAIGSGTAVAATVSSLTNNGTSSLAGDVTMTQTTNRILPDSDAKRIVMLGGSALSASNGGYVGAHGNSFGSGLSGCVLLQPGTAAGAYVDVNGGTFRALGAGRVLINTTTDNAADTLQVNGTVNAAGTTDSTSKTTGTLISAGGIAAAKNIVGAQGLGIGVTSTETAAATTTLSASSTMVQVFTGTTTQTVTLPAANAFGAGVGYMLIIKNLSTGNVTVNRAGADTINTTSTAQTTFTVTTISQAMLVSDGVSAWEKII